MMFVIMYVDNIIISILLLSYRHLLDCLIRCRLAVLQIPPLIFMYMYMYNVMYMHCRMYSHVSAMEIHMQLTG